MREAGADAIADTAPAVRLPGPCAGSGCCDRHLAFRGFAPTSGATLLPDAEEPQPFGREFAAGAALDARTAFTTPPLPARGRAGGGGGPRRPGSRRRS